MERIFFDAANKILNMYDQRQKCASDFVPAHSTTEISWACEMLFTLAGVAAYAGYPGSINPRAAAHEWNRSGVRPQNFIKLNDGKTL